MVQSLEVPIPSYYTPYYPTLLSLPSLARMGVDSLRQEIEGLCHSWGTKVFYFPIREDKGKIRMAKGSSSIEKKYFKLPLDAIYNENTN